MLYDQKYSYRQNYLIDPKEEPNFLGYLLQENKPPTPMYLPSTPMHLENINDTSKMPYQGKISSVIPNKGCQFFYPNSLAYRINVFTNEPAVMMYKYLTKNKEAAIHYLTIKDLLPKQHWIKSQVATLHLLLDK